MELLSLVLVCILAVLIGVGLFLGLAVCFLAAALTFTFVVAVSSYVGLASGRILPGLRVLFVQLGVLAGAPVGAVAALVLERVWPEISHHGVILIMGGVSGAFGGLLVALLAHRAVQMATERLPKLRLPRTTLVPSS